MTQDQLANVEDVYPLTGMQQGILYHTVAKTSPGVYVTQRVAKLTGDFDPNTFRIAWADLVRRHSVLRTAFLWDGLAEPLQVVRPEASLDWIEEDWGQLTEADTNQALDDWLAEDRESGFDLAIPPLMRMRLIRAGDAWLWMWTFHHIIADGWSAEALLEQVWAGYLDHRTGSTRGESEPLKYRDFVAEQMRRDETDEKRFWASYLEGFDQPHRLEAPGFTPGEVGHEKLELKIHPSTIDSLQRAGNAHGVTLGTIFAGAWSIVLSRWARSSDVLFGVTVAGRSAPLPGIGEAVGLFINTLPLRVRVDPQADLAEWLRNLQSARLETQKWEQSPLATIQRQSKVGPGEALFDSILVFENMPFEGDSSPDLGFSVDWIRGIEHSNYSLALLVEPGDGLELHFVYDSQVLPEKAIRSLGNQMLTVLEQFTDRFDAPVSNYRTIDPNYASSTSAGPDLPVDDRTIHDVILSAAMADPDKTALVAPNAEMTYSELAEESERIASRLAGAGVRKGTLVGLHIPRSIGMIVGMVGILRAGGAYVPLDPAYPDEHIKGLLEGDEIEFVLTHSDIAHSLPPNVNTVHIDTPDVSTPAGELDGVGPDDLAYVIHTSGSTGRPKGVLVSHRNLVASTAARTVHYGDPVGSFLLLSSFAFDSSVAGIFWTLTTGGTLVLPSSGMEQDIDALLSLARDQEVTHTLCLPSLYQVLLDNALQGELATMRVVVVAGEASPPGLASTHFSRLAEAELHNEYGPTEATVWATVHRATPMDRGGPLPIGRPIAGASVHILDELGRPVPVGFPGELCIGGSGVTSGYLGRPDLTAERFATVDIDGISQLVYRSGDLAAQREDGTILFLGRVDRQLKVRGHRIEAGAVETALRQLPGVSDAAVSGRTQSGRGVVQLVAHVASEPSFDTGWASASLRAVLPAYMVPDVIVPMDLLPRLPNGKVDVDALPAPEVGGEGGVAPRNEAEIMLAGIWSDLLGVETVGIRDDFFALGGDSIVSLQMISKARKAGIYIEPRQIVDYPTIEGLANAAKTPEDTDGEKGPVSGRVPLGPIQHWYFELEMADLAHWNQANLFEVPADIDLTALSASLQACIDRHDMLRARYEATADGWVQFVDATRTVELEVLEAPHAEVDSIVTDTQAGLDLERGTLVRAVLFRRGPDERPLLLVVVHHLVIDIVSWAILLEDLQLGYRQAIAGEPIRLSQRTSSFRDWILHLEGMDRSGELPYWVDRDGPEGEAGGLESSARETVVELDIETTKLLLTTANEAYQTRSEDLLVAALVGTAGLWSESTGASIALEGHGRPSDIGGIDLSTTVGWFTTLYPVTFERASDDESLIKETKESLRGVPDRGLGYGAARYIDRVPSLREQPMPRVLFNYLSRAAEDRAGDLLTWVSDVDFASRSPRNPRAHPIEIVAQVREDKLRVIWIYSSEQHGEDEVRALARAHISRLEDLITHCVDPSAGGFTPSDFPEAGLDQDELDQFLDDLS